MVSKKSFTLLVASRTTPFFVVVPIFLSRIVGSIGFLGPPKYGLQRNRIAFDKKWGKKNSPSGIHGKKLEHMKVVYIT